MHQDRLGTNKHRGTVEKTRGVFSACRHPSPKTPLLTDYGEDPGEYLECVSTYIGAVPALQAHTVGMLRQLADVRELQGNETAANHFRALAGSVASEAERLLYNIGKGYWSCLYNNGTLQPVAHSLDFSQLGRHMAVRAENTVHLSVVKKQSFD
jgi:hypothetical protein